MARSVRSIEPIPGLSEPALRRPPVKVRGFWHNVGRRLRRDRAALAGAALIGFMLFLAIFAPLLTPYDPIMQYPDGLTDRGQPLPGNRKFLFGTDKWGRDLFTRIIYGARMTLLIGVMGSLLAVALGVTFGSLAGYVGGWVDTAIMRSIDVLLSIPNLLLAMALAAILRPSVVIVIVVVAIANWSYVARIVYGETLSLKQQDFVLAAHSLGVPRPRILVRHLFPHLVSIIVVYVTLGISTAVLLEAALGYLGLGVPPPTPTWGTMISEGQTAYLFAPWLVLYPGLAILITVLGFNLLGDGLRDAVDPQQWH
jgi:peptide/nickel transport system permease protein